MGKTKSLHIYWWELDAVGRFSFFGGKVLIDTQKLNKDFFLSFPYVCFWFCVQNLIWFIIKSPMLNQNITPFGVHYKKICNHLCETATNSAKILSFISAKIGTFVHKSDSITIFAFLSTFNNTFGHSYVSFGIQKRSKNILSLTPTSKSLTPSWQSIGTTDKH